MQFGNMWDDAREAFLAATQSFEDLADVFRELNELMYEDELTPKEYATEKFKNARKDILRNARNTYSYIPRPQRNLPYQRRIY